MEIINRDELTSLGDVRLVVEGGNEIVRATEAYQRAQSIGLDLVLVSPEAKPPVVKIEDYNKIQYEKKKAKKSQRTAKSVLKEVRFKANISDHDFEVKLKSILKFLGRGDKVKISVRLKRREMPEKAREILNKVKDTVDCKSSPVAGRGDTILLEPPLLNSGRKDVEKTTA